MRALHKALRVWKSSKDEWRYRNASLAAAILSRAVACAEPLRVSSSSIPRYLALKTRCTGTPSHVTSKFTTCFNFLEVPKSKHSVFPTCKESLLSTSHFLQFDNSLLSRSATCALSAWEKTKAESSA